MHRKGIKQLIYGSFYLVIIGLLSFGVYVLALRPAPSCFDKKQNQEETGVDCGGGCQPCELNTLADVRSFPVRLLPAPNNQTSALIEFQNPNAAYGAVPLRYRVLFLDGSGNEVGALDEQTYIYAGEIVFRVLPNTRTPFDRIVKASVAQMVANWSSQAETPTPKIQARSQTVSLDAERTDRARIAFVLKNENAYAVRSVKVHAIIFNEFASLVGVSRTLVENLNPFEERSVEVVVPLINFSGEISDADVKLSFEAER